MHHQIIVLRWQIKATQQFIYCISRDVFKIENKIKKLKLGPGQGGFYVSIDTPLNRCFEQIADH